MQLGLNCPFRTGKIIQEGLSLFGKGRYIINEAFFFILFSVSIIAYSCLQAAEQPQLQAVLKPPAQPVQRLQLLRLLLLPALRQREPEFI